MRVSGFEIQDSPHATMVSAIIDGFRLWYRLPRAFPFVRAGDPFVAAALLPAMARGESLDVDPDLPVSPLLLAGLARLQAIHHSWNRALKVIPVRAVASPAASAHAGTMTFFSGGVDSTFTLLQRKTEISHLVFIQGFDFYTHDAASEDFSAGNISDLSKLAFMLENPGGAMAGFIRASLSKPTLEALSAFANAGTDPGSLEKRLADDLQRIVCGIPLHDPKLLGELTLGARTRDCLARLAGRSISAELNHLLLEDAFPLAIAGRRRASFQTAVERNTAFASKVGKTLVSVSTNHYPFGYRYNLSRNLTQGSALASVALLLGFRRAFIPAAYSYSQLMPLGSHPLTDPLWSTEAVEIVHEGAEARRTDKVMRIVDDAEALDNLRVCFDDMNTNCGRCAKCVRTMLPLRLLGVQSAPFPSGPTASEVRSMTIASDIEAVFLFETLELAGRVADSELYRALRVALRRYERRKLAVALDRAFAGGRLKRLTRRSQPAQASLRRIDTTTPRD